MKKYWFFKKVKVFSLTMRVALAAVILVAVVLSSCSDNESVPGPESVSTRAIVTVSGTITSSTTWSGNNIYRLDGKVYVTNGAKLTIQEGTLIRGVEKSTPELASALIVTSGSQIEAIGTVGNPIVFTAENGQIGGWGGLVILGDAIINQGTAFIEGINPGSVPSGVSAYYGGDNDNDDSGTLRYVRVEYAGASISEANELNAFTFGGVGSGTTLDHLQAYYGNDDSFEFFGGCVNAKYLVSTAPNDDNFDFDFGYTGKIQFAVSTIDQDIAYSSDPNGIECDNDGTGTGATPFTHPVLSNLTIVGTPNGQVASGGNPAGYLYNGARFRRNTRYTLVNSILFGYPTGIWHNTINTNYICEYNVVSAINTCFLGFPTTPAYICTSVNQITLDTPFGGYKSGSLAPTGGYALDGNTYIFTDPFFDNVPWKGGAWDPYGNYWLADNWVR